MFDKKKKQLFRYSDRSINITSVTFHNIYRLKVWLCAGEGEPFDYISVTPPYTQVDYEILMRQISNSAFVGEDTFIVSVVSYSLLICWMRIFKLVFRSNI